MPYPVKPPNPASKKGAILKNTSVSAQGGKLETPTHGPIKSKGSSLNGQGNATGIGVGGPYQPQKPPQGHASSSRPLS